ncbi:hypothetical protein H072_1857 [Dactylellina haptotyla CBS 200.50]|uniref:Chromosome transmission fidelity protein 8 n=1 Tax=Dactylellina haptotyla (strain CBS 200.50) TaxID=1284197 RepID=S8C911_DACHA|nr:hypothetical protein H072_1857 [Dactylellina haptotyla CBS 200.50]
MPTTSIHLPNNVSVSTNTNPLPQLLRLPSGLAILELQGDINFPSPEEQDPSNNGDFTTVGNLIFPDATSETTELKDLKRVWLYVGKHQRLTGEVKALPKPLGVLRKRKPEDHDGPVSSTTSAEELEIVDIIKYKIIFSKRPEPVSATE